jgi:hypothetical protein
MWDFPELTITEERAYRPPWYPVGIYGPGTQQGTEVYYTAAEKYYKVKTGAHPPAGTVPTNETYWELLDPVTPFVARDQLGRNPIGKVLGVYKSDPSLNGCAPHDICLKFRPTEKGTHVCYGPSTTVWVCFSMPPPVYTMVPWILGKAYAPGIRVYWPGLGYPYPVDYPGFGDVYRCFAFTSAQPPYDTEFWAREPVPDFFSTYLEAGAAADCLKEGPPGADDQSRFARAAAYENEADRFIQGVIDDLLAQGQKHYYIKPYWGDGWCLSEPWLGSEAIPLLPLFVGTGEPDLPVGLPPSATLIYRPEIVSLTGPEQPSLQAFPSMSYPVGTLIKITIDTEEQSWRIDAGPKNPADPGHISPDDYNVVTNNKHYQKVI